ncbi:hypothetical protein [Evansella halocellulosilytica]|uniref:hypothetical protein n=1 Tax=Evansella halocellulosilytica TaxID=2011013 RepID=UPI000BB9A56F|nr:hypothetical protein [Evansella halocellulosilytica]
MRKSILIFLTIVMVLPVSAFGFSYEENEVKIPSNGITPEILYKQERINNKQIEVTKTNGTSAVSDLKEENGVLNGKIKINNQEPKTYHLLSTNKKYNDDMTIYTGEVENKDLFFEAYLPKDRSYATINIFGLKDKDGDFEAYENRIDPFTVKFNDDINKIKVKEETFIEDQEVIEANLQNMGLVQIGEAHYDGIGIEIQTILNRNTESPWVTRQWTDVEGAKKYSSQPSPTAWIREAVFVNEGLNNTYFTPEKPSQNDVTNFNVPLKIREVEINIPVRTSETLLSNEAFDNPLQLNLIWNFRRASNFEYGNNDEGIAQYSIYSHDGITNSDGYYEVDFTMLNLYEMVDNEREYLPFGIQGTAQFY